MPDNQRNRPRPRARNTVGSGSSSHRAPYSSSTAPFSPYSQSQAPSLHTLTVPQSTLQRQGNPAVGTMNPGTGGLWDGSRGVFFDGSDMRQQSPPRTWAQVVRAPPANAPSGPRAERLVGEVTKSKGAGPMGYGPKMVSGENKKPYPRYGVFHDGPRVEEGGMMDSERDLSKEQGTKKHDRETNATVGKKTLVLKQGDARNGSNMTMEHESNAVVGAARSGASSGHPSPTFVAEPSPLQTFLRLNNPTDEPQPSSRTIDHVRKLRAQQQVKATASQGGPSKPTATTLVATTNTPKPAPEVTKAPNISTGAEKRFHDVGFKDTEWTTPAYTLKQGPDAPTSSVTNAPDAKSQAKSVNTAVQTVGGYSSEDDELIDLIKAIDSMGVFSNLPTPPERRSSERKDAVAQDLKSEKLDAAEGASKEVVELSTEEKADLGVASGGIDGVEVVEEDMKAYVEPIESDDSDDFELIEKLVDAEIGENGPKRGWFRGFRR